MCSPQAASTPPHRGWAHSSPGFRRRPGHRAMDSMGTGIHRAPGRWPLPAWATQQSYMGGRPGGGSCSSGLGSRWGGHSREGWAGGQAALGAAGGASGGCSWAGLGGGQGGCAGQPYVPATPVLAVSAALRNSPVDVASPLQPLLHLLSRVSCCGHQGEDRSTVVCSQIPCIAASAGVPTCFPAWRGSPEGPCCAGPGRVKQALHADDLQRGGGSWTLSPLSAGHAALCLLSW